MFKYTKSSIHSYINLYPAFLPRESLWTCIESKLLIQSTFLKTRLEYSNHFSITQSNFLLFWYANGLDEWF